MAPRIETILPLSPLQHGLLFHALYDESAPNSYVVQQIFELVGALDVERLMRAAHVLLQRHPNLRAGFLYHDLREPLQVIPHEVVLSWQNFDLTSATRCDQEMEVDRIFTDIRTRRFDPATPPLCASV